MGAFFAVALPYLMRALFAAPAIINAVKVIHAEKDTATKRQIAHDALMLSQGAADIIDPTDRTTIDALSAATHAVIDTVGGLGNPPAPGAIAPAATAAEVPAAVSQDASAAPALTPTGHPVWS